MPDTRPSPRTCRKAVRAALVALALVAFVPACGGSSDDEDADAAPTTATTDPAATSTTGDGPTETTAPVEGPEEWADAMRDVYERTFSLREDPNLDRIADVYAETCECYVRAQTTVQFLLDNGEHIEGEPTQLLFVRPELTDPETGYVNLTVMAETGPYERVNADGDVVQEVPATEPACVSYTLAADGPDGSYRIYNETDLPECPEEATG